MDATALILTVVAALGGWLLATPLLAAGDRLLATVPAEDAAPVAYVPGAGSATVAIPSNSHIGLTIGPAWRWSLRIGLALVMPLAVRRALAPANVLLPHHLPIFATIPLLVLCVAALGLIAVLDGAAHLVFAEIVLPLAGILAVVGIGEGQAVWLPMLLGALVCGGFFLILYLVGRFWYGAEALGFGDVQLAAAFGIMLGWPVALSALVLGLILMALTAGILLATKRITTRSYLPIGTFLALGALLGLILIPPVWL